MAEGIVYAAVNLKSNGRKIENTGAREHEVEKENIADVEYATIIFKRNGMRNQKTHSKGSVKYFRLACGTSLILLICVATVLCIKFIGSKGLCPVDWQFFEEKCYYFSHDAANWTASRDMCVSAGGDLVIIGTKEEQMYIVKKLNNTENEFWIGLTDSEIEGQWKWVDQTDLKNVSFWFPSQPNNSSGLNNMYKGGEDCGLVRHVSQQNWYDQYCALYKNRICEA